MFYDKLGKAPIICAVIFVISTFSGVVQAVPESCEEDAFYPEYVEIIHGCPTEPPSIWKAVLEATLSDYDVFYIVATKCNPPCINGTSHKGDYGGELIVPLSAGEWIVAYQNLPEYHFLPDGEEFDADSVMSWPWVRFDGSGACDERNFDDWIVSGRKIVANCDTTLRISFAYDVPFILQMLIWQTKEWEPIK